MSRRALALAAAGALALAGGIAAALVLALGGSGGGPTREDYLAQVRKICARYERRLAAIPAPVNFASPNDVAASVNRAVPLLQERADRIREVEPPDELEAQVEGFLKQSDRRRHRPRGLARPAGRRGAGREDARRPAAQGATAAGAPLLPARRQVDRGAPHRASGCPRGP